MKNLIFKIIGCTLLLTVILFVFEIFYPRSYNVPLLKERPNTRYWNLSSGSRIGYTIIHGKGNKKSYPIIYLHGGLGGHTTDRDIKIFACLADSGLIFTYTTK